MAFLTKAANRGSIATGYEIENSCKFESDNGTGETLYAVPWSSAGTRTTHTWSIWVKRTELGTRQMLFEGGTSNTVTTQLSLSFQTNDALEVRAGEFVPGSVAGTVYRLTNRVFRDTSAWYHIVAAFDTTQATANNRIKIWINGVQETSFATIANPTQNTDLGLFAANAQQTVACSGNNGFYYNGYITHAALVYNQQLDADSFGEFDSVSGIWKPIDLEDLTFGAFGFWLKFETPNIMGKDSSGNNHGFTAVSIGSADQATDTPTNNFATGNPLVPLKANTILTEGATNFKNVGSAGWASFAPSIAVQSGKWYVEFTAAGATTFCGVGNVNNFLNSIYYGNWNTSIGFYGTAGLLFIDGATQTWSGLAYGSGDIVGIALDKDNGYVYMSKNGTWANSGDPTSGSSGTGGVALTTGNSDYSASDYFYIGASQDINNGILQANYGGYTTDAPASAETDENGYGTFEYAPPSGYYALCSKNLAEFG